MIYWLLFLVLFLAILPFIYFIYYYSNRNATMGELQRQANIPHRRIRASLPSHVLSTRQIPYPARNLETRTRLLKPMPPVNIELPRRNLNQNFNREKTARTGPSLNSPNIVLSPNAPFSARPFLKMPTPSYPVGPSGATSVSYHQLHTGLKVTMPSIVPVPSPIPTSEDTHLYMNERNREATFHSFK